MSPLATVALLLVAAGAAALFPASSTSRRGLWVAIAPLAVFVAFILQKFAVLGSPQLGSMDWIPQLGVALSWNLDGLSLLFSLLISGIGGLVTVYACGYLAGHPLRSRFLAFFLLFMAAMLGLVLADNLLLLFIFWELTSISSYLLIGFNHQSESARRKALQALMVTGLGGICLLAGFMLLGLAGGSFELSQLVGNREAIASHSYFLPSLCLVLLGAFTKSAQFPFHFWLPNAMAAPAPVSALLHSATMVKAGIYLMLRTAPIYSESSVWFVALVSFGGFTLLYGATRGLFQNDLKRILAYTTIAALGMLTMLIGIGTNAALKAALIFLLGHAFYKATLFMAAGNVDHGTKCRDVTLLAGLRRIMPWTAAAAGIAALSKAGLPPMFGFLGKEYAYKAAIAIESFGPLVTVVAIVGNALLLSLALIAGIKPFWSRSTTANDLDLGRAQEAKPSMLIGPAVLAVCGLALGLFPNQIAGPLIGSALLASYPGSEPSALALWHGLGLPLALSAVTVALGLLLYRTRGYFWRAKSTARTLEATDSERLYEAGFNWFVAFSKWQTRLLQNGSMRIYLLVILGTTSALLAYKLLVLGGLPSAYNIHALGGFEAILAGAMIFAAIHSACSNSLVNSLISLGMVGFGVAILFAINGAPDLAITQIVVETLTVALFMFVVFKLPKMKLRSSAGVRRFDAAFATLFGLLVGAMTLKALHLQFSQTISTQLVDWSYSLAKGKNVVNVILVDFRALDTLGEIAVLGIAAYGVWAFFQDSFSLSRKGPDTAFDPVAKFGAKVLLPLCLVLSLIVLYRGHNLPGGGFIGGLVAASGFILVALLQGVPLARRKLGVEPSSLIAWGLAIAATTTLIGPIAGGDPLMGLWLPEFSLPWLGKIHLGTPLIFDVGVYLTVVGFSLQVALALQPDGPRALNS